MTGVDLKLDALRWQILQATAPSAKLWIDLAKVTHLSSSFADDATRLLEVTVVYERAVRSLPYSYKLWTHYLSFKRDDTRALCSAHEWFQSVREVYERAVATLPRMPLLWLSYLEFVMGFPMLRATIVRHLVSRSLLALPATQHHLIWRLATRWSAAPDTPPVTFQALWEAYLSFDPAPSARRQYLSHLQRRGETAAYVRECARCVAEAAARPEVTLADRHLLEDTAFWEPLVIAFQSSGWFLADGDRDGAVTLDTLDALVAHGRRYCASALTLELAYAGFLIGQGHLSRGRAVLWRLLDEAADPESFFRVFRMAVEMEDQSVESFALSERARELQQADPASYAAAVRCLFDNADPCAHLKRLVTEYPMLLNQTQLRCRPRCVPLWLKRVELLQERRYTIGTTAADLDALYEQAIAQCSAGLEVVDAAAAQLYQSLALHLSATDRAREAAERALAAAWHVHFSSATANALLLGLHVELRLLSGTPSAALQKTLMSALAGGLTGVAPAGVSAGARRRRGTLLASLGSGDAAGQVEAPTALPRQDARPWVLLADLAATGTHAECAAALSEVSQQYAATAAYTAEGAVHMAYALWWRGRDGVGATRELERALHHFRMDAVTTLYIAEQYLSFIHLSASPGAGGDVPLLRLRELFRVVEEATPAALRRAPAATLDLIVACASVEWRYGLYGNAVRLLQRAAAAALDMVDADVHLQLLTSFVERSIACTQRCAGCLGTRQFCAALLKSTGCAPLLQRVALHWAAVERRCGNVAQAHAVLDACGDSQDPSSTHGAVYWKLWESLCASMEEFERVVRRKQQVGVRFQKQQRAREAPKAVTATT